MATHKTENTWLTTYVYFGDKYWGFLHKHHLELMSQQFIKYCFGGFYAL